MKVYNVLLNDIEKAKEFVRRSSQYEDNVDLISGRYVIDAKSIMGVFSLDLSKRLNVRLHSDDEDAMKRFEIDMEQFQ